MGVVIPSMNQLWLVNCIDDVVEGQTHQLVSREIVAGCQAVSFPQRSVMLVLDHVGKLNLYSGPEEVREKYIYIP